MKNYTIAVAGTGYVGLSIATLLSQNHKVYAVDIVPEKVELINNRKSPIQDEYIEKYLAEKDLDLTATLDAKSAYKKADFVVIAAPTNYDSVTQNFNTAAVEDVIKLVMEVNPDATMVIKSTIPVGYTKSVREKFHCSNILFSPEFLRESKALYDNLYPSRIIVGTDMEDEHLIHVAHEFTGLLQEGAIKEDIDTLYGMNSYVSQAEFKDPTDDICTKTHFELVNVNNSNENSLLIDCDYFKTEMVNIESMMDVATVLHNHSSNFLMTAITDKLNDAMEPEELI